MILEKLLDTIAPNCCIICEQENGAICLWCLPDAFPSVPDRCFHCFKLSPGSAVCKKCRKQVRLSHVWCATVYKNHAEKLVKHMKFNPDRSACGLIARWLDQTMPYFINATITYAPTAPARVRQRGFDHAKLIAKEFARLRGLPFAAVVARSGALRQVGHSKTERLKQVSGNYRAVSVQRVATEHVIVIDDIVTTGATLNEIAKVLKAAGVKQVSGLVFAQTI